MLGFLEACAGLEGASHVRRPPHRSRQRHHTARDNAAAAIHATARARFMDSSALSRISNTLAAAAAAAARVAQAFGRLQEPLKCSRS